MQVASPFAPRSMPRAAVRSGVAYPAMGRLLGGALAALLLAVAVGACGSDGDSSTDANKVDWLLVQNATDGSLEADGGGSYRLVLSDVEGTTVAFSDTPYREVQLLPTADVVHAIEAAPNKPNAALQISSPTPATAMLTLRGASYDQGSRQLSYTATLVKDGSLGEIATDGELPAGELTSPTLFVDGEPVQTSGTKPPPISRSGSPPPGCDQVNCVYVTGPFEVGSKCLGSEGGGEQGICWDIKKGGENWSPQYKSVRVAFKNTGTEALQLYTGFVAFGGGCRSGHNIAPGATKSYTFHHQNYICISPPNPESSGAGRILPVNPLEIEIVGIKQNP